MTAHGDVYQKKSARARTVEDALVNGTERMAFDGRTGENFVVDAFSRIDRMRWRMKEDMRQISLVPLKHS